MLTLSNPAVFSSRVAERLEERGRNGNTVAAPVQVNIQIPPQISDVELCRVIDCKAASQSEAPIEVLPGPGGRARR